MLPCTIAIKSTFTGKPKFLVDSQCDFHLSVGDTILSLHRQHLEGCKHICKNFNEGKKVYVIQEFLNVEMLKNVLGYFYGFDLSVENKKDFMNFLDVVDFLEAECLRTQIQKIISVNIQKFDLFYIMEAAFQFNLKDIWDLCFKELQNDQYEQMNYNRYDFMQCNFKLFQIVLRRHHILKKSQKIVGQPLHNIQELIMLYSRRYHYNLQTTTKLMESYVNSSPLKGYKDQFTDRTKGQTVSFKLNTELLASKNLDNLGQEQQKQNDGAFMDRQTGDRLHLTVPKGNQQHKRRRSSFMEEEEQKNVEKLIKSGQCIKVAKQSKPVIVPQEQLLYKNSGKRIHVQTKSSLPPPSHRKKLQNTQSLKRCSENLISGTLSSLEHFQHEEPELIAGKISDLLQEYNQAVRDYDQNFSSIKEYARSMMASKHLKNSNGSKNSFNEIFEKSRFTASRNLRNSPFWV